MTDREQIEALSKQVEALTADVCELKGVLAALEVEDITSLLEDIRFMRDNPPMSEGLWCAFCEREVQACVPLPGPHAPEPLPAEPHESWCPTPNLSKMVAVFEKLAEVNT